MSPVAVGGARGGGWLSFGLGAVVLCAYGLVGWMGYRPGELGLGAVVTFWLPGAALLAMDPYGRDRHWAETVALEVGLSVAYIGLVALFLDQTAIGIHQWSLACAVAVVWAVGGASGPLRPARQGNRAVLVPCLVIIAGALVWPVIVRTSGVAAGEVDSLLTHRPSPGGVTLTGMCTLGSRRGPKWVTITVAGASGGGLRFTRFPAHPLAVIRHAQKGTGTGARIQVEVQPSWSGTVEARMRDPAHNTLTVKISSWDCVRELQGRRAGGPGH